MKERREKKKREKKKIPLYYCYSMNHRTCEVGRDMWRYLAQFPCSKKFAQGCVQLGAEYLQGWRLHKLSGQPVPMIDHPHSKEDFS